MAEEKDEGEVQKTSGNSSVEEEKTNHDLDSQISTIEDQLSKAQATLFELQKMRADLELEKKEGSKRFQTEKELEEAEKVKKENQRLRSELKEYQSEIVSIKEVIGSLKDNLVKTAERLENKVEKSIKSLGDLPDLGHHTKEPHRPAHRNPAHRINGEENLSDGANFFNDHLLKINQKDQQQATSEEIDKAEEIKPKETVEINKKEGEEIKISSADTETSGAEKISSEVDSVEQKNQETDESQSPDPNFLAKFWGVQGQSAEKAETKDDPKVENVQPSGSDEQKDDNTGEIDQDLDEYELIRQELMALEGDGFVKASTDKLAEGVFSAGEGDATRIPEAKNVDKKEQEKPIVKSILSLFKKKPKIKEESIGLEIPQDNIVVQQPVAENSQDQQQTENSSQVNASPVPTMPPNQNQTEDPVVQETGKVSEVTATAETVNNDKLQVDKPVKNFKSLFKRKKAKPEKEGGVNDSGRVGPTGKLAIGTAVLILLVSGTIVAYKIKNADALRQTYTSKATEAVTTGNANVLKNEVPNEFANLDPYVKYKEAYADAPFEETAWANYTDPEIGISIDYPKNTSYRLKPVASNTLWFLRKDGFLLKIEKITTDKTLEEISTEISADVKYISESVVIRDRPAMHLVLQEHLPVRGNIYLSKYDGGIYKIWYKTFLPNEDLDDQKRVVKMLDTLDFIATNN